MRHLRTRRTYYLAAFTLVLLSCATLLFDDTTASGYPLPQSTSIDNGTIPPPGTIPPACPEGVKAPERGKIMVFLDPVAIYSGCSPQINPSAVMTETGFVPTLLYHDYYSGSPEAIGYMGEVFAVFDYSYSELDRLVSLLETFRCEEIGNPLEVCRQVNGIRISQLGFEFVTASEMRAEADAGIDLPSTEDFQIYIPFMSN